jgi:hypothetical protein
MIGLLAQIERIRVMTGAKEWPGKLCRRQVWRQIEKGVYKEQGSNG